MKDSRNKSTWILQALSSSKLALILVALVILFSIIGALLPQEGMFDARGMEKWQGDHPIITLLFRPLGMFHVFYSIPFMAVIFLLGINTLTCTIIRIANQGGLSYFRAPGSMHAWGFLLLHISLIGLFAGGFMSVAFRLDGYIILTEGQSFKELHSNYLLLAEGPLRRERHKGFTATLEEVSTVFHEQRTGFPIDLVSRLRINRGKEMVSVKINYPYTFEGMAFTQDKTGYSPRLMIRDARSGHRLIHSYAALKTFREGQVREYRDFLPLPEIVKKKQRLIVTLLPQYERKDGKLVKTGEQPVNPILVVELKDADGTMINQGEVPLNGSIDLGEYRLQFTGLRRWSSFRVVDDPGYQVVWISLLICVIGIFLRYIPDLTSWFQEDNNAA